MQKNYTLPKDVREIVDNHTINQEIHTAILLKGLKGSTG